MTSFADLPPVAGRLVAAGDHLTYRALTGDRSCGCPGWSGSGPHDDQCPLQAVDGCLTGLAQLSALIGSLVEPDGKLLVGRLREGLETFDAATLPAATMGLTLALVGAARLAVNIDAHRRGLLYELTEPAIERYAVLTRITTDSGINLAPQTAARLLLSPHIEADINRMRLNISTGNGAPPELSELTLAPLIISLVDAVHRILAALPNTVSVELRQLATDGMNLLATIPNFIRQGR